MCGSAQAVYDYLYHSMRDLKIEVFKVLYLDSQNHLLAVDELLKKICVSVAGTPLGVQLPAVAQEVSLTPVHVAVVVTCRVMVRSGRLATVVAAL